MWYCPRVNPKDYEGMNNKEFTFMGIVHLFGILVAWTLIWGMFLAPFGVDWFWGLVKTSVFIIGFLMWLVD